MKYFVLLAVVVAVASAVPLELVEDEDGEKYYLVPLSREKRQSKWGISNSGVGGSHRGTLFNNNNHRLDGTASASKNFGSHGLKPDQFGGRLDYSHNPSRTSAFVGADRTRNYGTDVSAGIKHNLHQSKNFGVDAVGSYNRHFGGPGGTGRPDGFVGIQGSGKF